MSAESMIRWEKDADGVVVLTLDDPNQSANTMNELYTSSMGATLDRLEAARDSITGVILTSAKKVFLPLVITTPVMESFCASSRSTVSAIESM